MNIVLWRAGRYYLIIQCLDSFNIFAVNIWNLGRLLATAKVRASLYLGVDLFQQVVALILLLLVP